MRILLIGDIVGKPGRKIVKQSVRGLVIRERLDLVVANAENAASGSGLTPANYDEIVNAGVNAVTMGDHIYRRRAIYNVLESKNNIVKPANYPEEAPGHDYVIVNSQLSVPVAVISLMGRVFMKPVDFPFDAVDRVLSKLDRTVKVIVVDFHAEATSDMQLMGRHLDNRVSAVLGTHTHVATADESILPGGTAFQCDVGMTGPHDSILGRRIDRVMETTRTFRPTPFDVATGDVRLNGTIVDIDQETGRATGIRRLCVTADEAENLANLQQAGGS
ncbi:MAG: TIGR00282 family metallophosphoesterase [Pirellulales bacterium]